jgi:N-acyl-D-amino-acid deacylase
VKQAIRSMTSLPAEILGMKERGRVAEGYFADLAVIDLSAIRDASMFVEPHQLCGRG